MRVGLRHGKPVRRGFGPGGGDGFFGDRLRLFRRDRLLFPRFHRLCLLRRGVDLDRGDRLHLLRGGVDLDRGDRLHLLRGGVDLDRGDRLRLFRGDRLLFPWFHPLRLLRRGVVLDRGHGLLDCGDRLFDRGLVCGRLALVFGDGLFDRNFVHDGLVLGDRLFDRGLVCGRLVLVFGDGLFDRGLVHDGLVLGDRLLDRGLVHDGLVLGDRLLGRGLVHDGLGLGFRRGDRLLDWFDDRGRLLGFLALCDRLLDRFVLVAGDGLLNRGFRLRRVVGREKTQGAVTPRSPHLTAAIDALLHFQCVRKRVIQPEEVWTVVADGAGTKSRFDGIG